MAFPTSVNEQITDSVTQANTSVLGDAPAVATGNFFIATSQALGNAAHNATTAQQQSAITAQAATTMGVATLYAIDTASAGKATATIFAKQSSIAKTTNRGEVTPNMVIGHMQSMLATPAGKEEIAQAIAQAQASKTEPDMAQINASIEEIKDAIATARNEGVSDQAICYTLHQVAHDKGISMLYPSLHSPDLTEEDIFAYYKAIVDDFYENRVG